jgi:hypothetical protein
VSDNDSTLRDVSSVGPVNRVLTRTALCLLVVAVAAGAVGALGLHTSTASASADGYTLEMSYPRTARAGLDVEWQATVTHVGGFDHDVTLAMSAAYFGMFETQGFFPEPSEETRDGDTLYLTFTKPDGDTFVVGYDAYIQPSSQRGSTASVSVVDGGTPVVTVRLKTTLLP